MIVLSVFGPAFGLPDPSPFVTKAWALLSMSGLPYRTERRGLRGAPKGKLPYVEDGDERVSDSTFIRLYLERKYSVDFDHALDARQRATAWALERMLEEHLYWLMIDERWLDDGNFAKGPAVFFRSVPTLVRPLIQKKVRSDLTKTLRAQGLGRHSPSERLELGARDLQAVSQLLGGNDYLFGAEPCGADATAFAFVLGALCPLFESPLRTSAACFENLSVYCERMQRRFLNQASSG